MAKIGQFYRRSRSEWLAVSAALTLLGCGEAAGGAIPPKDVSHTLRDGDAGALVVPEDDDEFAIVDVAPASQAIPTTPNDGDLWASCWAADDALYAACGDGRGFDKSRPKADIVVNRVLGSPLDPSANLTGTWLAASERVTHLRTPGSYYAKPTGMACVRGELYLAVQSLNSQTYGDAPAATVVRSRDHGATWIEAPALPMFDRHLFTTIMFLDFGRDGEKAIDGYVYAYGIDQNWRFSDTVEDPTRLYLARVPRDSILVRGAWEFFAGVTLDPTGKRRRPTWSPNLDARVPVLVDESRTYAHLTDGTRSPGMTKIAQGGIVYDAPLRRYIYTSWTEWTFETYVAAEPWGPWKKLGSFDFGMAPWTAAKNGGYGTTAPSKFISSDGRTLYIQANTWSAGVDRNAFSLRRMRLVPRATEPATNAKGPAALARTGKGVTPVARAMHHGTLALMNDGAVTSQSEDSATGEAKTLDYWGYAFEAKYRMNKVVYTTGAITSAGGWFENLGVQVRVDGKWISATGLTVLPPYPASAATPSHTAFTLTFDELEGDGVRILGKPGGKQASTSIAELTVSYE